jgi:uncharacterized protein (TIGR03083 family)
VMGHLPGCASCAAEAARLRGTAGLLGAAVRPPESLRARTMERAKARRPAAPPCPGYAEPYAAQVSVLDSLLAELADADWRTGVIFDWSVQDVLAHLAATDGLVAAGLGLDPARPPDDSGSEDVDDGSPADADDGAGGAPHGAGSAVDGSGGAGTAGGDASLADVLARRTAAVIDRERARAPGSTRATWRAQAHALCRALPPDPAERFPGMRMRVSDVIVARAFETWVHSDDIATTLGRRLPPPLPRHLRAIAALGVRSLPKAMAVMRSDRPGTVAQVVLDGPGGGEWTIGLGGTARAAAPEREPSVRVRMDVLEFCFLAGGRRDPATVDAEVTGDMELGRELLVAAPAFAGP